MTIAVFPVPPELTASYVNVSVPVKPSVGVYSTTPPLELKLLRAPCAGFDRTAYGALSGSAARQRHRHGRPTRRGLRHDRVTDRRHLQLERPDVAPRSLWPQHASLVGAGTIGAAGGHLVERRATGRQRHRHRRSAIALQRPEQRVGVRLVGLAGDGVRQTAVGAAVDVAPEGTQTGAGPAVGGDRAATRDLDVSSDDRVLHTCRTGFQAEPSAQPASRLPALFLIRVARDRRVGDRDRVGRVVPAEDAAHQPGVVVRDGRVVEHEMAGQVHAAIGNGRAPGCRAAKVLYPSGVAAAAGRVVRGDQTALDRQRPLVVGHASARARKAARDPVF